MKPKKQKPVLTDQKVPVFLRLAPAIHDWLMEDVKAGRYGNVQEKISEILRREQETKEGQVA